MNILIFSLGEKGLAVVKALALPALGHSLCCVIGRDSGVDDDRSSVLTDFCEESGIAYGPRGGLRDDASSYDVALAVGWRWMIRDVPEEKLVVFHDSLLPRYRGFAPLVNALLNKEPRVGVTALWAAEEYDRGNILLQKSLAVAYPTSIEAEISRISDLYAKMAFELIQRMENGTINRIGVPQDEAQASYSLWRDDQDYRIDWTRSAHDIVHFMSCVGKPYRSASSLLNGAPVRVVGARAIDDVRIENRTPGKIIRVDNGLPIVVCGQGLLLIEALQDETGASKLPLESFRSRFC